MDPFDAGWLSLLPPIIAITLALITKEVISSLFLGILSGTVIYCLGMGTGDLIIKPVEIAFTTMVNKVDFNIIIFCTLLGALVFTISRAGGTRAYGNWATKRIKSKRVAMLSTGGLGAFIFIDDYFNCLTVGTVMRPVTDRYKISRAKLAYIIDATAAPICIIAPVSSWAAAVAAFRDKQVNRIILTRPAVEAGERLGFLPGDLQSKVDPYLRPLYDALFDMLGAETYNKYLERGSIEVAPLAYMRGRTLDDSFIILDEAQNTSREQMKMFLTRLGFGSKIVITGDITQIDLPRDTVSGLKEAMRVLDGVEDIAICRLNEADVVRHVIVQRIIKAYEEDEKRKGKR